MSLFGRSMTAAAITWTVAAAVWVALAAWQPARTWHLIPLLLVVLPCVSMRIAVRRPVPAALGWGVAVTALGLTVMVAGVLFAAALMTGSTLIGFGSPVAESVLGAFVGMFIGGRLAARRTPVRWLGESDSPVD